MSHYLTSMGQPNVHIMASSPEELDIRSSATGSDRVILVSVILLMMIGLVAVYSAIAYFAETNGTTAGSFMLGHSVKMLIAFVVMLVFSKLNYRIVARFSSVMVILSWILLIVVLVVGTKTFGAKRWLSLGGFTFQPSSLASVALIIRVAYLLNDKQDYILSFKRAFLPLMFWIIPTCALIGIEDFSSAGLLMVICLSMMIIGRVSMLQLSGIVLLAIFGASVLITMNPERGRRIDAYLEQIIHIKSDDFALNEGYQAQQAQIAIARGAMFGVGIGKSSQRDFLPAPYNDFIYAIITEEYGLLGATVVLLLFVVLLVRGLAFVSRKAEDELGMLLAVGCTLYVCFLGFINAGVACGVLPVTGLPMPFVSYGGTSMLFAGVLVGVLLNISKHRRVGS